MVDTGLPGEVRHGIIEPDPARPGRRPPTVGGRTPPAAAGSPGGPPMAAFAAERNLLFGLLALQNGLIDQGQLVAAFQAWTRDKARTLAEHLDARGELDADQRAAVEAMVRLHLKKHGDDAGRSLAAIP